MRFPTSLWSSEDNGLDVKDTTSLVIPKSKDTREHGGLGEIWMKGSATEFHHVATVNAVYMKKREEKKGSQSRWEKRHDSSLMLPCTAHIEGHNIC